MDISGRLLNKVLEALPKGSHVDLVMDTAEVREVVKACADIIAQGWDSQIYCQLETWRRLMDTRKSCGSAMTVREFEEDGDDCDCAYFRYAAEREAWQAEKDAAMGTPVVPGLREKAEGNRTHLKGRRFKGYQRQGGECVPSTSSGVPQEEVQKKHQLGTTQ
jgi:hypothetical protein